MSASRIRHLLHGLAASALAGATVAGGQGSRPFEYQQVHMGLPVRILLHAPDERRAASAARAAFRRIAALDEMMSDYRPDSELRRLEATGHRWTRVSPELFDVVATSLSMARATDGAFDPTVGPLVALWREARTTGKLPEAAALGRARARVGWRHVEVDPVRRAVRLAQPGMRLDLGGIAKGFILQQALRSLQSSGLRSALVESGGDIVVGDAPPGVAGWRVETPATDAVFHKRAAELANAALATSGSTEQFVRINGVRYSHIVDPRTGLGVTHQRVARVIARDAAIADALATALVLAAPEGLSAILERFPDAEFSLSPAAEPR